MKRALLFFLMFCLILNATSVYAAPLPDVGNYASFQCENIEETDLRFDLKQIIAEFFANDKIQIDFETIVDRPWRTLNVDLAIDSEVDNAVSAVKKNTGLGDKLLSNLSRDKIEELTTEVTEIAFNSLEFKSKLDQLSNQVANELSEKLVNISVQSSSLAMRCLQRFIGTQYSETVANEFSKVQNQASSATTLGDKKYWSPDTTTILDQNKIALGGIGVIIVTQITKRIVQRIGTRITQQITERILGRVGAAAIPFLGEIVGGVMIGIDIINSYQGAFPHIQESLKSSEVKEAIRKEIVKTTETELRKESSQIASEIYNEIYSRWVAFKSDYTEVLNLAKELPEFNKILEKTADADLAKLSSLVRILLNKIGRYELKVYIRDGSFECVLSLPEITYQIIETSSLPVLIDWVNLAGNQIEDVVETELYKHLSPKELDRPLLKRILSLQDPSTIAKLSLLDVDDLRKLLMVSKPNLVALAVHLSVDDLQQLASYLGELDQIKVNRLVQFLLSEPTLRGKLKDSNIITYIVESRDINAAIQFWTKPSLLNGIWWISTGDISWRLFVEKYGISMMFLVIFIPLFSSLLVAIWCYRQLSRISQDRKNESLTQQNDEVKSLVDNKDNPQSLVDNKDNPESLVDNKDNKSLVDNKDNP